MGLFGKKKTDGATGTTGGMTGTTGTTGTTTTTQQRTQGWQVDCAPQCGFMVRTHNKDELAQLVKTHMRTTHNQTVTDTDALKNARTVNF